jgi:hypothetical protein
MGMVVIHRDNKATTSSNSDDNNLAGLEEHIKCPLCHDFLTDAVTLVGCLHFCMQKISNFLSHLFLCFQFAVPAYVIISSQPLLFHRPVAAIVQNVWSN